MVDLLKTGSDWLAGVFKTSASRSVVYSRGTTSATVSATIGRSTWELETSPGIIVRYESRDFLIQTADLVAFGEPQRNDKITEDSAVYEVMGPGASQPYFRYSDQYFKVLRIHTKKV